MRLCTFVLPNEPYAEKVGIVRRDEVLGLDYRLSMMELVRSGGPNGNIDASGETHGMADILLRAPVPRPGKILATIVNTQAMLGGKDVFLDRPRLDMKSPNAVIGARETIKAPPGGIRPEVELAAIIGKGLTKGTESEARRSIFGYTVLNDVTAPFDSREDAYEAYRRDKGTGEIRKSKMRGPLFRSKNHDTFCPMGPWIVTADEITDLSHLRMTTKFDSSFVQDGSTSEYLFSPEKIASYVSGFLTLEAGDVISCGSVGWTNSVAKDLDPTEYILPKKDGILELEIQGIGSLINPVSQSS